MDQSWMQPPEDIARAVLFFADSANTQVSGTFLAVNGVSDFIQYSAPADGGNSPV